MYILANAQIESSTSGTRNDESQTASMPESVFLHYMSVLMSITSVGCHVDIFCSMCYSL